MGDGCKAVHGVCRLAEASRMVTVEIARGRTSLIGVLNYRRRRKSSSLVNVVLAHYFSLIEHKWKLCCDDVDYLLKIELFNCDF